MNQNSNLASQSGANVVALSQAKGKIELKKKEAELQAYFSNLDFHQLILETQDLISILKSEEISRENILRGKLVLAEFSNRTRVTGSILPCSLSKMVSKISSKLGIIDEVLE